MMNPNETISPDLNINPELSDFERKGRGRGFADMNPERRKQIASQGGLAAHSMGKAYQWTSEQARAAAYKSVEARRQKKIEGSVVARTVVPEVPVNKTVDGIKYDAAANKWPFGTTE